MFKFKYIYFVFLFIFILFVMGNKNVNEYSYISNESIEDYNNSNGLDKTIRKKNIIEQILVDSENTNLNIDKNKASLKIMNGAIINENEQNMFIVTDNSKSIIAVYEDNEFIGVVDTFVNLIDVQIMPLNAREGSLIVVREDINNMLGAFEDGVYIRGYAYYDGAFHQVLSILEEYVAYYNNSWNSLKQEQTLVWEMICSSAYVQWTNETSPVVEVTYFQEYGYALSKDPNIQATELDFTTMEYREVKSTYYWSNEWNSFIMGEAIYLETGEEVAILDDLSLSPFALVDELIDYNEKYIVKYKNGEIERIGKEEIELIEVEK